jgi:hypothetical protein
MGPVRTLEVRVNRQGGTFFEGAPLADREEKLATEHLNPCQNVGTCPKRAAVGVGNKISSKAYITINLERVLGA